MRPRIFRESRQTSGPSRILYLQIRLNEKKPVETTSYEKELGGVARVIKSLKKMSKNDPFL